jgi:hypothetical protein
LDGPKAYARDNQSDDCSKQGSYHDITFEAEA